MHAFGASNVLDAGGARRPRRGDRRGWPPRLAATAGFRLRLVDAGGGLGIPYEAHETPLDLGRARAAARRRSRRAWPRDAATRGARILLSPAASSSGPAGAYVARVVDRKTVGGQHVVILDGGIHHVLRPALVGQEHRVVALTGRAATPAGADAQRSRSRSPGRCAPGSTCSPSRRSMALPEPGDLVAVLDVGAYGATESMPFFLSHPLPAEIAIRGGEAWARPAADRARDLARLAGRTARKGGSG